MRSLCQNSSVMKNFSQSAARMVSRRGETKEAPANKEACSSPGHCPGDDHGSTEEVVLPPSMRSLPSFRRAAPPEAERRAFEQAVSGWWWL
jgi:hypothetical protein